MLCSAVFLKLDYIIKAVLMVVAVLAYILTMHYPRSDIFDFYDKSIISESGSYNITKYGLIEFRHLSVYFLVLILGSNCQGITCCDSFKTKAS